MTTYLLFIALLIFTGIAGFIDLRTGHIPNPLVLASFIVAIVLRVSVEMFEAPAIDQGLRGVLFQVVGGAFACALVPLLLYRFNALGGGDVKLLIVVGTLLGPMLGLQLMFYAFVIAAVYACARLVYQGQLLRILYNSLLLLANPFLPEKRRRSIPTEALTSMRFGPAVFVGACLLAFDAFTATQI
jgi:prepilin peptidase CpaA